MLGMGFWTYQLQMCVFFWGGGTDEASARLKPAVPAGGWDGIPWHDVEILREVVFLRFLTSV